MALFVQAYNFQRPHQGIGGLVPADRYFRAAPQVRAAVEASVQANALRLALQKPVQKPFYLVGRLGDRDVSIAAAGSGVQVQLGDEAPHTISFTEEDGHVDEVPPRVQAFAGEDAVMADSMRRSSTAPPSAIWKTEVLPVLPAPRCRRPEMMDGHAAGCPFTTPSCSKV